MKTQQKHLVNPALVPNIHKSLALVLVLTFKVTMIIKLT